MSVLRTSIPFIAAAPANKQQQRSIRSIPAKWRTQLGQGCSLSQKKQLSSPVPELVRRSNRSLRGSLACKSLASGPGTKSYTIQVHEKEEQVGPALCELVAGKAKAAINARGCFVMAIPGGSVLGMLKGLSSYPNVDWAKVHVFYVNHKCVSMDDDLATHKKALDLFVCPLGIPELQVYALSGSDNAAAEAEAYEERMRTIGSGILPINDDGLPVFDLMLLGMGSDGHIGSLYPNRPEIMAKKEDGWCLGVVKEKPPASITLTLPVINAAATKACAMTGRDKKTGGTKAAAVAQAIEGNDPPGAFPAQGLEGAIWILDTLAAENITYE